MKNVYKWRIVTNKYLYLTDENNAGPFIFNKITKERIYECSGTPQVDDYGVDEGKISQIVSEIRDAHVYETMFNNMVNLAMCDTDAQKLHFLTYDKYFNLDSEECVQEAVTPKCEGYEPVFNISAHTIDETEVEYTFFLERNEQDKTLRYKLDLGIPRGLTGEKGEAGESGCQGAKGEDGKNAVIAGADATVYTLPVGATPEAQVEVVPESTTTEDENQYVFHFDFGLPTGVQGNPGPQGIRGANGKDAIITDASATIDPLEYGQQPQVSVSAITTPTQEENQTELRFHFDIPAGPQGEVGPAGAPSLIHEARVGRIDTLEPGSDANVTVEVIPYEQSANSYDLVFSFGIPRGADGSSGGGGGGWTYNIDDPTFIEDAGISVPYGQFNTVYHPGDGEADVTLTIHYPSSWGQGGGETKIPEIEYLDTTISDVHGLTGITYADYPRQIMPVFTDSYYGINGNAYITYKKITRETDKIDQLINGGIKNVTIKVNVPYSADSGDTMTMYTPGSIIRDGGDKFGFFDTGGTIVVVKAAGAPSENSIESCLIFGMAVEAEKYFLTCDSSGSSVEGEYIGGHYHDENASLTPMLYATHLVKMKSGNDDVYYKGGFPIITKQPYIGIWGSGWT